MMVKRKKTHLRLFLIECASPLDVMESRVECEAVGGIARLIGHSVLAFSVQSKRVLRETCAYIGSICDVDGHDLTPPMCLHISAHGSSEGLLFGGDHIPWSDLLDLIQPVFTTRYDGPRVVVLSSCEADQQKLTETISARVKEDTRLSAPRYIFCVTGSVGWPDAAVGWTLLYHMIPTLDLDQRSEFQSMLSKISAIGVADIVYFRWDDVSRSYKRYAAKGATSAA